MKSFVKTRIEPEYKLWLELEAKRQGITMSELQIKILNDYKMKIEGEK